MSYRILIIEDVATQADIWRRIAEERGCQTVTLVRNDMGVFATELNRLLANNALSFDATILDIVIADVDTRGGKKLWQQLDHAQKSKAGHLMVATSSQLPDIEDFAKQENAVTCFSAVEMGKVASFCKILRKICVSNGDEFHEEWAKVKSHSELGELQYQLGSLNRRMNALEIEIRRLSALEQTVNDIIVRLGLDDKEV